MTEMKNQMQIKTEVKATINQIKQLIAEKYSIVQNFDLEIVDETVQIGNFVAKQEDKPNEDLWYPDDSGEWVEIAEDCVSIPEGLKLEDKINYLLKEERDSKDWCEYETKVDSLIFSLDTEDKYRIIAYKKVK